MADPLIVHVHNLEGGLELIDQSEPKIVQLFKTLSEKCWPGPLTLVTKANLEVIPLLPTAETWLNGIHLPSLNVMQNFMEKAADVPISAPSASTFDRTKAAHV